MSAPATFVSNRLAELPPELNGPNGQAWARGMGTVQDQRVAVARVAAISRLPFLCPDDALDACGAWLLLPRFPGEPNGTAPTQPGKSDGTGYRGRLCNAWETWILAGSKAAIIRSLNGYGLPDVTVVDDYEKSPPWPGSWWSRFEVDVGPSFGGYGWGPGNDPTTDQQKQMVAQVLQWKWAYSYPVKIHLADPANSYEFDIIIGPIIDDGFIIGNITPDITGGVIGGFNPIG